LIKGLILIWAYPAVAAVSTQCPGDNNGDAVIDGNGDPDHPNAKCLHLAAGDGFVTMADGKEQYMFGFADITGTKDNKAMQKGMLAATFPAPKIVLDEGDEFYLNLTNVGMMLRPDLFDPHTVHWHGFPEAASIFDGVPDASVSINMGSTFTYYYNVVEPGTYMYHCHVEATEHMQMGMLGNLYVKPAQNKLAAGTDLNGFAHQNGFEYAYNDGDGSTFYNADFPIQIGSFDSAFHDASETVQPLPFAMMRDNYPMLNGRGYPDTVALAGPEAPAGANPVNGVSTQNESALVTANAGDRVLLRLSNLNVTRFYTLQTLGISMQMVGKDAKLLRGPDGKDLYYNTSTATLGGGESMDAIIEIPADATSGTVYYLYTSNLNYLNNNQEDFGGMMTEIRVN
jgi:FtsP/CotA-like multicopper oxidase with cupredoxin domain